MKPLHLNLAARPYRNYRPVYAVVVVASLLIAFLMLNNIETYYRYVNETRTTRATIESLDRQTATERQRTAAAEERLGRTDLRSLSAETRFVNARIAERAFSWSELLERLEGLVPDDVRLRNITPSIDKNGLVHLELSCESRTATGLLDTIQRFQKDPRFARPFPHNESIAERGTWLFAIGVDFKPTRMVTR